MTQTTRLEGLQNDPYPKFGIIKMAEKTIRCDFFPAWSQGRMITWWNIDKKSSNVFRLDDYVGFLWHYGDNSIDDMFAVPKKESGWPVCIDNSVAEGWARIEYYDGGSVLIQL